MENARPVKQVTALLATSFLKAKHCCFQISLVSLPVWTCYSQDSMAGDAGMLLETLAFKPGACLDWINLLGIKCDFSSKDFLTPYDKYSFLMQGEDYLA